MKGGEDVFHRDVEHLRLGAVDVRVKLRCVGAEAAQEPDELRSFRTFDDNFPCGLLEGLISAAPAVLDHHSKAADVSHAADWRGRKDKDQSFIDRRHFRAECRQDFLTGQAFFHPLLEGSERRKDTGLVRRVRARGRVKARKGHHARYPFHLAGKFRDLANYLVCSRKRSALWQLGDDDEVALILGWDEPGGDLHKTERREREQTGIEDEHNGAAACDHGNETAVVR